MMSRTHSSARREFAEFLEQHGVVCRLIGPFAPATDPHTDVNVVVAPEDWPAIPSLIDRYCQSSDLRVLLMDQPERGAFYFVIGALDESNGLQIFRLYIFDDLFLGGRKYLNASALLAASRSDVLSFEYYFLRAVETQGLTCRCCLYLRELWLLHPHSARARLLRYWPEHDVSVISEAIINSDWDGLRSALPRLRRSLRRGSRFSWNAFVHRSRRGLSRLMRPEGLVVVVLGPDGSGKSSVIDSLKADMAHVFTRTQRLHFRPKTFSRTRAEVSEISNPHSRPARGLWTSLVKLAYYASDNILGYLFRIRPVLTRAGFVAFDRYYHDLLVDPRRYRYGGPRWAVQWLGNVVPRPHLFLLLDAPVAVIQARRQEVSTEEMVRQRGAYRSLARRLLRAFVMDASQEREDVTRQAEAVILNHVAAEADVKMREAIKNHPTIDVRLN